MTQSNSERFKIGDLVELKSGGPTMTVGKPVTKEAHELRGEATSIVRVHVEQMLQLHAQVHSLAAHERLSVTELFELPADQFEARFVEERERAEENPEYGLGNTGLGREVVYCEWFARETRKHHFFSAGELKRAEEEKK